MAFDVAEAISGFAGRPLWGVEDWGFWKIKRKNAENRAFITLCGVLLLPGPVSSCKWNFYRCSSCKKPWKPSRIFNKISNCWIEVDTHRGVLMVGKAGKGWGGHPTDLRTLWGSVSVWTTIFSGNLRSRSAPVAWCSDGSIVFVICFDAGVDG